MAKLKIKNFLSLKSTDIELQRLTVLIGPQAQGKSLILKLVHFFESVMSRTVSEFITGDIRLPALRKESVARFEAYFPKYSWGTSSFSVTYQDEGFEITVSREGERANAPATITFGTLLEDELKSANALYKKKFEAAEMTSRNRSSTKRMVFEDVLATMSDLVRFRIEPVFIPASRSFFANIEKNIFALISSKFDLDLLMAEFGTTLEATRRGLYISESVRLANLQRRRSEIRKKDWADIINGEYVFDGDEESIETDGRSIRLANSSSGQQEVIPLLLVLDSFSKEESGVFLRPRGIPGVSFFVEEPEAHLFPKAQKVVSSILVEAMNRMPANRIIFTTHSPYMLTAINNLNLAGRIAQDLKVSDREKMQLKFPKNQQIAPGELAAFKVDNGRVQTIMDKESGLVNGMLIDEVSVEFATEFDELLSLRTSATKSA